MRLLSGFIFNIHTPRKMVWLSKMFKNKHGKLYNQTGLILKLIDNIIIRQTVEPTMQK